MVGGRFDLNFSRKLGFTILSGAFSVIGRAPGLPRMLEKASPTGTTDALLVGMVATSAETDWPPLRLQTALPA